MPTEPQNPDDALVESTKESFKKVREMGTELKAVEAHEREVIDDQASGDPPSREPEA